MIYVISGVSYDEIKDLSRHGIKTFELVCADHITIAQNLKKNDMVFITNLSKQDIGKGIEGIVGKVKNLKIDYWRTVPREFDEKELLTVRIQIEYVNEGVVTKSKNLGDGKGMQVDYETHMILG